MSKGGKGPWVKAALVCQVVKVRADGMYSLVDIGNRKIFHMSGRGIIKTPPTKLKIFVAFYSDDYVGEAAVSLILRRPNGQTDGPRSLRLVFGGAEKETRSEFDVELSFEHEGVHWFDVLINDEVMSRVPVYVEYRDERTLRRN